MEFDKTDSRSFELKINEFIQASFVFFASVRDFEWINSYDSEKFIEFNVFAQMILSEASAVGCAIANKQDSVYMSCTFDKEPTKGSSVYEYGPTGSKCQTGMNPKYPGLCNVNELKTEIESSASNQSGAANQFARFTKITILAFNLIIAKPAIY